MKRKTVLILGAGASSHLRFPLGDGLREKIFDVLLEPNSNPIGRLLLQAGYDGNRLMKFRQQFLVSGSMSVDAFIQEWPDWEREGKATIAAFLLQAETDSLHLMYETPEWYRTVSHAIKDHDSLWSDHLSIITFNYDRSLEHYLRTALPAARNVESSILEERIQRLEILHFYGDLGSIWKQRVDGIEYGVHDHTHIEPAAESIHLIGRSDKAKEASSRAMELWRGAQLVVFLGFGYHDENLKRLGFEGMGFWDANAKPPKFELLTPGLTRVRRPYVERAFAGFNVSMHDLKIQDFLNNFDLFA